MIDTRIENETTERVPEAHVMTRMRRIARGDDARAITARVTFTDVNGPKGGRDKRCAVVVHVPGEAPVRAEDVETTARLAFDASYVRAVRQIARARARRDKASRRPKKYYAAKRLLA